MNNTPLRTARPDFMLLVGAMVERLRLLTFQVPRMVETINYTTAIPLFSVDAVGFGSRNADTDELLDRAFKEAREDMQQLFNTAHLATIECNDLLARQELPRRSFGIEVTQHVEIMTDGRFLATTSVRCRRYT